MSDKVLVKKHLVNFLESISFVGFTEDINMGLLTQAFRRIYKEPANVETETLLNFLVTMALSLARFNDFDVKSREFIEKSLNLID